MRARIAIRSPSLMALEAIGALGRALLPEIAQDPADRGGPLRTPSTGAWLCGMCLGAVGMALHHKLCHTLGGIVRPPAAPRATAVGPAAGAGRQRSGDAGR